MNRFIFTYFTFWLLSPAFMAELKSQEVIAPAGDYFYNNNTSISWTLGESITNTHTSGDILLIQGFHQGDLQVSTFVVNPALDFSIEAYPNPTSDLLWVNIKPQIPDNIHYMLFDTGGRLLQADRLLSASQDIPFDGLTPGTYILRILQEKKPLKVFTIIKN